LLVSSAQLVCIAVTPRHHAPTDAAQAAAHSVHYGSRSLTHSLTRSLTSAVDPQPSTPVIHTHTCVFKLCLEPSMSNFTPHKAHAQAAATANHSGQGCTCTQLADLSVPSQRIIHNCTAPCMHEHQYTHPLLHSYWCTGRHQVSKSQHYMSQIIHPNHSHSR
jgi:hypothetical protein